MPLWVVFGVLKAYQRFFQKKTEEQDPMASLEKVGNKELLTRLSSSPDSEV